MDFLHYCSQLDLVPNLKSFRSGPVTETSVSSPQKCYHPEPVAIANKLAHEPRTNQAEPWAEKTPNPYKYKIVQMHSLPRV